MVLSVALVFRPELGDGALAGVVLHLLGIPADLQRRANCRTRSQYSALGGNRRGSSNGSPDDCRHFPAIAHCNAAYCKDAKNSDLLPCSPCSHLHSHTSARSCPDALPPARPTSSPIPIPSPTTITAPATVAPDSTVTPGTTATAVPAPGSAATPTVTSVTQCRHQRRLPHSAVGSPSRRGTGAHLTIRTTTRTLHQSNQGSMIAKNTE